MRLAVVVNPAAVRSGRRLHAAIDGELTARGWPAAQYLPTSVADPGGGQALAAQELGADRVLVAGGDGTMRMVLGALRGTGLPVGLIPSGTGNLLARNLRVPLSLKPALSRALDGAPQPLDLLHYTDLDTGASGYACVMAGVGADAAVVADTDARLKRLGQWGYALAGLRHIRARAVSTQITLNGEVLSRGASLVEVGNLAELRAGIRLLPGADGTDGLLNVLIASPRTSLDVVRMISRVLLHAADAPLVDRRVARDALLECAEPVPCQIDGDLIGPVRRIRFEVLPGAAQVVR